MAVLPFRHITHKLRLAAAIISGFGLLTAIFSCAASNQNIEDKFTRYSGAEFAKSSQKLDVP